jgi:hypothetical protein
MNIHRSETGIHFNQRVLQCYSVTVTDVGGGNSIEEHGSMECTTRGYGTVDVDLRMGNCPYPGVYNCSSVATTQTFRNGLCVADVVTPECECNMVPLDAIELISGGEKGA